MACHVNAFECKTIAIHGAIVSTLRSSPFALQKPPFAARPSETTTHKMNPMMFLMNLRNWFNYMLNFLGEENIQITADRVFSQNEVKQMFTATVQEFKDKLYKAGEEAAEKKHAKAMSETMKVVNSQHDRAMKAESRKTARELKQSGVDPNIICRSTGLSLEEIREL